MEIRNGIGDGTFRAPVLYAVPPPLSSVGGGTLVTGDFNRDGKPDIGLPIIGANPGLAVLLNTTGNVVVQPALGALTATPATIASGNLTELRISLSQGVAPSGGFTFSVSSSNVAVLSVPSSVFMAAGTSSVRFNGTARNVTTTQSATVRIRNDQLGRRETAVTVTPGAATSTSSTATLQVFNTGTGALIGTLGNSGGGQYRGEFSVATNPQNITVRSSLGGSATRAVDVK